MASFISLNNLLKEDKCSFKEIKQYLERDSSNINGSSTMNIQPALIEVIASKHYSFDIVKLLLEFGADVNALGTFEYTALLAALGRRDEELVRFLLNKGADPNRGISEPFNEFTPLYCAVKCFSSVDVFKLLIESGADVNRADSNTKSSILCYALRKWDKNCIEFLFSIGISANGCKVHTSALVCYTFRYGPLRADVLEVLLKAGACNMIYHANEYSPKTFDLYTPVHQALQCGDYETKAIELLLELPEVDSEHIGKVWNNSLLHFAVLNPKCKLDVVKLLIERGDRIDAVNILHETLLHVAVEVFENSVHLIKFLCQIGVPVNKVRKDGKTPLLLALEICKSRKYKENECQKDLYETIIKYCFLENLNFCIDSSIKRCSHYFQVKSFVKLCGFEAQKVDSYKLAEGLTLHKFLSGPPLSVADIELYESNLNKLFELRLDKAFPIFFDVITSKIGKSVMKIKLRDVFYAVKQCSDFPYMEKVFLNYEIISLIAESLAEEDMLRLILAFCSKDADNVPIDTRFTKLGQRAQV